jgi:hypothetical protein
MMTGAGSVREGHLRHRVKWNEENVDVPSDNIVMFRPSGRFFGWSWWTDADVKEIRSFIAERRYLGEHLNFIVSSAAVARFENEVWPELPPVVGTVVINQPYYQPFTRQHRGVLKAGVKPKFVVIYTLDMPEKEMASHEAGPSRFEDPSIRWNYVVMDGRKLDVDHGKATGVGEDWSFSLMPPVVDADRIEAYQRVRAQIERFGVAGKSLWREPILNYWTSDYEGKPAGKAAAEAASMTHFARDAKKVLLAGDGAGAREAYEILTRRLGIDGVVWDRNLEDQEAALKRALQEKNKPDAVLGFYGKRAPEGKASSEKKRGGVFAGFDISDADFQMKERKR